MTKVALGMSGGVDSSTAALLLKNSGFEVLGVTLDLCKELCDQTKSINDAALLCKSLGIEHYVPDFSKEFRELVIDDFISEYISGRTPNPCICCNKHIKFGKMLSYALNELNCDMISTGHYARVIKDCNRFLLCKAEDKTKDQTYMLYSLTQEQLSRIILPLGDLTKDKIREIARSSGIAAADRPDSQDICFVPDGDYSKFIEEFTATSFSQGNFIDISGNILGKHNGIINYTVGQRKGLGIALGSPAFVISKNTDDNTVVLSTDEQMLFYKRVEICDVNFIVSPKNCDGLKVKTKLRYRQPEQNSVLHLTGDNTLIIEFDEPQRAPAPGQAAVFYDGDVVVGGGTIVRGIK